MKCYQCQKEIREQKLKVSVFNLFKNQIYFHRNCFYEITKIPMIFNAQSITPEEACEKLEKFKKAEELKIYQINS